MDEIQKQDRLKAVKVIRKNQTHVPKKFHEKYGLIPLEAYILLSLSHPFIVSVDEVIQNEQVWCVVMECPVGFEFDDALSMTDLDSSGTWFPFLDLIYSLICILKFDLFSYLHIYLSRVRVDLREQKEQESS